LAQKLFRQALSPSSDKLVSWAQFNREPLANRNFTFWQWFNGVMELTKSKHCQPHWLDKGVVGFIGKAESQEALMQRPGGSFLLRFSDSEIAGLTIAWVSENEKAQKQVWNLQPHTAKDFNVRGLADRIRDLEQLHYVLSQDEPTRTVPKEDMFNRYYTKAPNPPSTPADGYVKAELSVTIPRIANMNLGSPSHDGSITSPRSPASGFGDHNSIMSSPSQATSGPVDYGMSNENQNRPSSQNQDFNSFEGFDGSSMSHTIDVNELLSKVN